MYNHGMGDEWQMRRANIMQVSPSLMWINVDGGHPITHCLPPPSHIVYEETLRIK